MTRLQYWRARWQEWRERRRGEFCLYARLRALERR